MPDNKMDLLPTKISKVTSAGINDAFEAIIYNGPEAIKEAGFLLREDPKGVIRRVFRLNVYQRAALQEMTADEVRTLVAPVHVPVLNLQHTV